MKYNHIWLKNGGSEEAQIQAPAAYNEWLRLGSGGVGCYFIIAITLAYPYNNTEIYTDSFA